MRSHHCVSPLRQRRQRWQTIKPSQTTRSPTVHGTRRSAPTSTTVPAHSWPGITGKLHPPRVGEDPGHHLDVGPAQARLAAADEHVVGTDGRRLDLSVGDPLGRSTTTAFMARD